MCSVMLAVALAGCVDDGEVGSVGVALETTGADGAIYRLPAGSELVLQSSSYGDVFSLDGNQPVVTIAVPAGDYQAQLQHANGYTAQWPLERELAGTIEIVIASLITPMPAPVTVTAGSAVGLALSFRLASGGDVTFDQGDVDVTVDVGEGTPAAWHAAAAATVDAIDADVTPEAPPALSGRLPVTGDTGLQVVMGGTLTGDWSQPNATWACTQLQITSRSADDAGLQDLMTESYDGTTPPGWAGPATLCVYSDLAGHWARLRMSARHVPTTATFSDLGTTQIEFVTLVFAQLSQQAFDGQTLDLDVLAQNVTGPVRVINRVSALDAADTLVGWYFATFEGTGDFSFTGTF